MAVVQSRSIGVQTQNRFFSSDNFTQTISLNTMYSFAESLSDWVINEAFRYGRDVEKFAACIADFILLQVFMEKSINNLTSYVEDCMRADRPYCCLRAENLEKISSANALKNLNKVLSKYNTSKMEHHPSCLFKHFQNESDDWKYCSDDDEREFASAISSPDPLQVLEDDIIKCLQILTDDEEELFSEISDPSHQHLNQSSELDSGFLSSEDNFSIDHRIISNKKSYLPSLSESLEESSNFSWPEFHIPSRNDTRNDNKKEEDRTSISDRQKFLRTLLVEELKGNIEERKKKNEDFEISNAAPAGPMFKAQATKAIWMPGRSSAYEIENLSSPFKSESNCLFAQNENDACQNVSANENSENFSSKKCNGVSNTFDIDDMERTGKTFSYNVEPSNAIYNIELIDKSPPQDAVIVDQKVTIKDGNIHQDTYYAMPYDKITSTKTIIKAPTYEGIGPTEDGVPIGLRTSVKKEHSSDWYKTMFRSLHKSDSNEGLKYQSDGYMSDPELNRKDKSSTVKNKIIVTNKVKEKPFKEAEKSSYSFPAAKSSIQTYNHKPWIISDYEPGCSSIADNESLYANARHLPPLITPKPKYVYNDGYDSDSTLVRKTGKAHTLDPQQQKQWYQNIQKGGEIPLPGLCKPAPKKPQEPIVGPPPPMPTNWDLDSYYRIYAPKSDDSQRYTSPLHSPVQSAKRPENNKHKLQDDFLMKLDDVILNKCEDNIRQSSAKSPNGNNSLSSQNVAPISLNKVVILYDFIAQSSRELSLRKGDIVNIQRRIDKNWYEGKIDGKTGIFPVSYAEPISSKSQRISKKYIKGWARTKYDFIAKNQVELTLYKDDLVSLIREVDSNWYEGSLNGKTGIFPISYVEIVSESEYSAKTSKSSMPSSTLIPERNGRNEIEVNNNDIEDAEIINTDKAFSVSELLPSRNNFTKYNFTESEYNNSRVSPYQALYAYKPQNDDELELKEGDVVYVVEKCDDGWFVGTSMRTGLFGTFPGNYIEKI